MFFNSKLLILLSLLATLLVACGSGDNTTVAPEPTNQSSVTMSQTMEPSPLPTVTPVTIASELASLYDVDESNVFSIKELGDEYVKLKRGEPTSLKGGQSILTQGCHVGDTVRLGDDLYIAFSPDGKVSLKNNMILVTGFDELPKSKACYEMVVVYRGLRRVTINFNPAELQRFSLVDGKAIRREN